MFLKESRFVFQKVLNVFKREQIHYSISDLAGLMELDILNRKKTV